MKRTKPATLPFRKDHERMKEPELRQHTETSGAIRAVMGVLGTIAGLALGLAVIITMLYVNRPADPIPTDPDAPTPEQRLAELRADEEQALTRYGWIDREQGIVRIPIDRAMEKLVTEYGLELESRPGASDADHATGEAGDVSNDGSRE